jgi:endonuclease-3
MSRLALLSKAKIQLVFERLQAQNPQPTTELIYHSTFELLIAVMLSAQATD